MLVCVSYCLVAVITGYANQFIACFSFCLAYVESARPELHSAEDQIQHHDRRGIKARYDVRVQGSCSHWRRLWQLRRRDRAGDKAWRWVLDQLYVLFTYSFLFRHGTISYRLSFQYQLRHSRSFLLSVFSLHLLSLALLFFFCWVLSHSTQSWGKDIIKTHWES